MGGHWITSPEQGVNAAYGAMGFSKSTIQGMDAGFFGDAPPPAVAPAPPPAPSLSDAAVQAARLAAAQQVGAKQGLQSTFAPTQGQDTLGSASSASAPPKFSNLDIGAQAGRAFALPGGGIPRRATFGGFAGMAPRGNTPFGSGSGPKLLLRRGR